MLPAHCAVGCPRVHLHHLAAAVAEFLYYINSIIVNEIVRVIIVREVGPIARHFHSKEKAVSEPSKLRSLGTATAEDIITDG